MITDLFKSKKFLAALAGVVFVIVNKLGLDLDEPTVITIVGLIAAYVIGQGHADTGKEARKLEATTAIKPREVMHSMAPEFRDLMEGKGEP